MVKGYANTKNFFAATDRSAVYLFVVDSIRKRREALTLVSDNLAVPPVVRELDWSILMAHAQKGERDAYRRLLGEITPYVRSLAAKRHRDDYGIEDKVQDVLQQY